MAHLGEAGLGRGADPLRRGVGGDELRMGRLELLQLAEHTVEFLVLNRGCVKDVVVVVRLIERGPQLGRAFGRFLDRSGQPSRPPPRGRRRRDR